MKKVILTVEGKRFEIELEESFADFIEENLRSNDIAVDKNTEISKLLKIYLQAMKDNFNIEKQIKILINETEL